MTLLLRLILMTLAFAADPRMTPFRDSDLDSVLNSTVKLNDSAVIYSWSPHMNLSVRGLADIIDYGRKNKIRVIAVLDPDANFKLASEIVAENKWPTEYLKANESLALLRRGARIQYPSYHFISRGKFSRPPLPGYKLNQELDEFRRAQSK